VTQHLIVQNDCLSKFLATNKCAEFAFFAKDGALWPPPCFKKIS